MLSPVQLVDYTLESVSCERITPTDEPNEASSKDVKLGIEMGLNPKTTDPYQLKLTVQFNQPNESEEESESLADYKGYISIVGLFTLTKEDSEIDDAEMEKLLLVNGMSILYGIARTYIRQLTEPGPSRRLLFPSLNFYPMVEEWLSGNAKEIEEKESHSS